MSIREMLEQADLPGLERALQAQPQLANQPFSWGPHNQNRALPLAYLCDLIFEQKLTVAQAEALFDCLTAHGAQVNPAELPGRDTPLISACSLYADAIALRMLDLGADLRPKGTHGGTALHWAAYTGAAPVVAVLLVFGADPSDADNEFAATPLEWAREGQKNDPHNPRGRDYAGCISLLQMG